MSKPRGLPRFEATPEVLGSALEAAGVSAFDWDLDSDHVEWSDVGPRSFGPMPHDAGLGWIELAHAEDRARFTRALDEAKEGRAPLDVAVRLRTARDGYVWFLCRAELVRDPERRPSRLVGALIERAAQSRYLEAEAERTAAEARARNERMFSDTMVESMAGILYFFDRHGHFLRWNRSFETVSGYAASEIEKMHPLDFFSDEERPLLATRIAEVFERGESSVEARFRTKEGALHPYYFTGRRVVIDGSPCLVGVGIDISERKVAEAALRELNETLEAKVAERTEELRSAAIRAESADRIKSAFLATMSHELRTPLNSILGFTGILLQGLAGPLNEEQQKQLTMVRSSARHLLELIRDVLDLSKIEADQLEVQRKPYSLRDVVEMAVASVRPHAERKRLDLTVDIAEGIDLAVGDARRVEQVLLNLLNNAIKFTQEGSVKLAVSLEGARAGAVAVLSVVDTGIGIDPQHAETIFQPFRQIDTGLSRKHDGTGLGLAISRRLARLLGGDVVLSRSSPAGSELVFTLPIQRGGEP